MTIIALGHFLLFIPLGVIYQNNYSIFTGIFFGLLWFGVGKIQEYTTRQEKLREKKTNLGPEFMSFDDWRNKK